ncbi:N-acetyltransferase [Corynebacterium sp. ES2794-CONJ1]|uniref:GNAT family N-acetyltransferase n=1 Tax=unclassified Corynebacterium TaxID=2624378 RepID=UPI00216A7680|nr:MULTISPECIES: GNAT family N-acetyltransferase [unclassified Corynebacterium]MCS4490311.1 N-acetyltransferase [Corynebacterium sp. ES2775-CONJ]MCS4531983.1 N-acetyltransferase [Corynebacterium sp. ES2730-CONJ]MCU9519384.1 N-acetyltransferase [Corynebacterium sp. ES2794-CONJ1]
MTNNTNLTVVHDSQNSSYHLMEGTTLIGLADYRQIAERRNFHHTEIFPDFQGRGLSQVLIKGALDDSIAQGFTIRPSCSAVAHFVSKNRETYADHVN